LPPHEFESASCCPRLSGSHVVSAFVTSRSIVLTIERVQEAFRPARCQTITMKLPLLLLAVVLQVSGAASVPGATQAQLGDFAQVEQQLARAWVESDRATIDRIIASDWTTIAITGQVLTRAEVMADFFRNGKSPISAMTIDDIRVRPLGEVAVVTGRTVARATGSQTDVVLRFTDIFAWRNGRWQIVASQGTRAAP
jgi:hypothetical protein